jgi:hypothetical protein
LANRNPKRLGIKSKLISVRIPPNEYDVLVKQAKKLNVSLSRYIYLKIHEADSIHSAETSLQLFELLSELKVNASRVASNLNQEMKLANTRGFIDNRIADNINTLAKEYLELLSTANRIKL